MCVAGLPSVAKLAVAGGGQHDIWASFEPLVYEQVVLGWPHDLFGSLYKNVITYQNFVLKIFNSSDKA
jgi:hypothetical protein